MTEEEYFRKNYPDSCYGDRPLSPHWDFFQDGVEFGERKSEKRIEELEATNKNISNECHKLVDSLEKKENENVELIGKVAFLENDLNNAKARIEKLKCLEEEIIKTLKKCPCYEWLPAHNGEAKYIYLQSAIDIVRDKFEEIKEK